MRFLTTLTITCIVCTALCSANYFKRLANYWLSIEERYLSGLDSDDEVFNMESVFGGPSCRGFRSCLKKSGVNFESEYGDYRCRNLTKLFDCYKQLKNDCIRKKLDGWQHIFVGTSDNIRLPLPSQRRFNAECDTPDRLSTNLVDCKFFHLNWIFFL